MSVRKAGMAATKAAIKLHNWDGLNRTGRQAMRSWYRLFRHQSFTPWESKLIVDQMVHGVNMASEWGAG